MFLAVDIGNTSIGIAVFEQNKAVFRNKISTRHDLDKKDFDCLFEVIPQEQLSQIRDIAFCSVVPELDKKIHQFLEQKFPVKVKNINIDMDTGLTYTIDYPQNLGADILAGVCGTMEFLKPPFITIDSGTAITIAVVNDKYEYCGGAIIPGLETSVKALTLKASKLSDLKFSKPTSVLGKNTGDSLNAGVFYNTVGGLNLLISEYKKMFGDNCKVAVTGGLSLIFQPYIKGVDLWEENLVYLGIQHIYRRNSY